MTLKSSFVCRSCFFAVPVKDWRLVRVRSQFVYKKTFCLFLRRNADNTRSLANVVDCPVILFSDFANTDMSSTKDELLVGLPTEGLCVPFLPLF